MARQCGFSDLGFAKVDIGRQKRRGFPEVIYSPGKTAGQIRKICGELLKDKQPLLLTKLSKDKFNFLKRRIPRLKYSHQAKLGYTLPEKKNPSPRKILVISGGTADLPIAEEATLTLEAMGYLPERLFDVGVAGVHRLMHKIELLRAADTIIVVAGMEGALASLVSGLVSSPVIAVPTSCGYGANFAGLSPLLTMLNSCSPGVVTVNIDNGFGAGYFAALINKLCKST